MEVASWRTAIPSRPAGRDSLESDPAYDYAEDTPVSRCRGDRGEELLEEAERLVPLDKEDFLGDGSRWCPWTGRIPRTGGERMMPRGLVA